MDCFRVGDNPEYDLLIHTRLLPCPEAGGPFGGLMLCLNIEAINVADKPESPSLPQFCRMKLPGDGEYRFRKWQSKSAVIWRERSIRMTALEQYVEQTCYQTTFNAS